MDEHLRKEITRTDKWMRLLYTVIFAVMWQLAELVLLAVAVIQFLWNLFGGEPNTGLRDFGHRLGAWLAQVVRYVTFASDARPWPFGRAWPDAADLPVRGEE